MMSNEFCPCLTFDVDSETVKALKEAEERKARELEEKLEHKRQEVLCIQLGER